VRAVPGEAERCGSCTWRTMVGEARWERERPLLGSLSPTRVVWRVPESGRSDWGSGVGGSARRGQEVVGSEKSCLSAEGEG
jgi:hypothetical protein